jgi:hypothetical protein
MAETAVMALIPSRVNATTVLLSDCSQSSRAGMASCSRSFSVLSMRMMHNRAIGTNFHWDHLLYSVISWPMSWGLTDLTFESPLDGSALAYYCAWSELDYSIGRADGKKRYTQMVGFSQATATLA